MTASGAAWSRPGLGEERLRALLRHAFDVVLVADADARVREVLPGRSHDRLPPAEAVLGRVGFDLVHPEERPAARRYWERAVAGREPMPPIELRFARADGGWGRAELVAANALDDPAVGGVVVTLHDVTDARHTPRRSEHPDRSTAHERLAEAERLEAVGRFAAGVAHDFNNVLAVLRGHVDLLAATLPADAPGTESLAGIERAVARAADLVDRLLALGRTDPDAPEPVDLRDEAAAAAGFCRPLLPPPVRLDVRVPDHPVPVRADRSGLQRVLVNLLVNARDALDGTGDITVSVAADGAAAVLTVADTGAGMPADTLARCTEPFFTTKGAAGTGLGLATAHRFVVRQGGTLHVDSAPGAGTTVSVRLPLTG